MHLVKMEQEQVEKQRQKEEEERRRKKEEAKRKRRMLEAAFDGDVDEMETVLREVKTNNPSCNILQLLTLLLRFVNVD